MRVRMCECVCVCEGEYAYGYVCVLVRAIYWISVSADLRFLRHVISSLIELCTGQFWWMNCAI